MSRRDNARRSKGAPQLPFALKKELGINDDQLNRGKSDGRNQSHERHPPNYRLARGAQSNGSHKAGTGAADIRVTKSRQQPKSIPKNKVTRAPEVSPSPSQASDESRASSPGIVLDAKSRSFKDRTVQDDAEIAALEKKLGMKGGKSKVDDEFDLVLEGLDDYDEGKKRKREGDDWLRNKRRKAGIVESSDDEEIDDQDAEVDGFGSDTTDEEAEDEDDDEELTGSVAASEGSELEGDLSGLEGLDSDQDSEDEDDDDDDGEQDFGDFDEGVPKDPPRKVRENPYVAPVSAVQGAKYVPPAARRALASTTTESGTLNRLRKQVQGHLNRLAEANAVSILNEVENLYQNNPRSDVTTILIEVLLQLLCPPSTLSNTFIILHAAFVTAVYKVIGIDFGAEFLTKIVEQFQHYHQEVQNAGKEPLNLISLLTHMFIFHTVSSTIVFDHIRLLLEEFSETNTELVLRVIHDCGPQLRQEDPTAVRNIVQIMATSRNNMEKDGTQMSVRTRFMIERIEALRDNKMKNTSGDSAISRDLITRLRKMLGSLNNRTTIKASDPMNITLSDIQNTDKRGKWWLVGASWKGRMSEAPLTTLEGQTISSSTELPLVKDIWDTDFQQEVDLHALARDYGMNTDVRRSILIAMMSAADVNDGFIRLTKLNLKRTQQYEIPAIILRCVQGEEQFNPYYTLLARKLCADKKMKKAFQFTIWDFFKKIGEGADEDSDDEAEQQQVNDQAVVNIATMFGHLIVSGSQSLDVLRKLNLTHLKEQGRSFVEVLLFTIFTSVRSKDEMKLIAIFATARETPGLASGLQYFMSKKLKKSRFLVENKKKKEKVLIGSQLALDVLQGKVGQSTDLEL